MQTSRFIVEAFDEYGTVDYDSFETAEAAIECAKSLGVSSLPRVVDRQEQSVVWSIVEED